MSVLQTPRISFRGHITWDPIVTNNYPRFYDEADSETVLRPGESAAAFRASAVDAVKTGSDGGNWNPHGTHRSLFYETRVCSVDLGGGPDTRDTLVGQPVSFAGMLVDAEPYGAFTSQLFFDRMSFGIDGGCRVLSPRATRMTARRINFGRNLGYSYIARGASVMWQTAFPKTAGLRIDAHDSKALAALEALLEDDDVLGLTVRWNAYRTLYFDNPEMTDAAVAERAYAELQGALRGGGFQPNPARSEVVGVLGLWRRGEPCAVGGDRFLVSAVDGDPIASAYARVGEREVTLDLQNSVPETGLDLTKKDFGDLELVARDPRGVQPDLVLATLAYEHYRREAYELCGGLVSLPVEPEHAQQACSRDLCLRGADGTDYLVESPLYACPEQPNVYLDAGQPGVLSVRVLERGMAPSAPVALQVVGMNDGRKQTFRSDAEGLVQVPLQGAQGSVQGFMLIAGDAPIPNPQAFDPVRTPYFYQRTLAADEGIAALPPTWDNVYRHVLVNWHAMAPCMDNWLDLGDEAQLAAYAPLLRRLTAAEAFEDFRFMPVTRDLTPGQRTLLYRWLDTVEKGTSAPAPERRATALQQSRATRHAGLPKGSSSKS